VFDKHRSRASEPVAPAASNRIGPEDERIALRCARRELQLVDSFVVSGEFRSRSDLVRAALRDFLRRRVVPTADPPLTTDGPIELTVRLRRDEVAQLVAYAKLVGNERPIADLLAELVRRGELEAKVRELVDRHRLSVREAEDVRSTVTALERAGQRLEDRGVVGR